MRMMGLLLFMVVLIITLTNIASLVGKTNGIPDVLQGLLPESPQTKEENKALETLEAPFAEAENAVRFDETDPPYDPLIGNIVVSRDLEIPHRNEADVSAWVTEVVGQALTFTVTGYEDHRKKISEFMGATASAEFQDFMVSTNILNMMQSRNFELRAFATDIPQLVTTGVVRGRYRWIYDIPVNLTFLPPGTTGYDDLAPDQYISEHLTFRLQLGRVAEGGREGILIETWEALKKKSGG